MGMNIGGGFAFPNLFPVICHPIVICVIFLRIYSIMRCP